MGKLTNLPQQLSNDMIAKRLSHAKFLALLTITCNP